MNTYQHSYITLRLATQNAWDNEQFFALLSNDFGTIDMSRFYRTTAWNIAMYLTTNQLYGASLVEYRYDPTRGVWNRITSCEVWPNHTYLMSGMVRPGPITL